MKRAPAALLILLSLSGLLLADPWEAIPQSDLEQQLKAAENLVTTPVCIPFANLRLEKAHRFFIGNPGGTSFDLLFLSSAGTFQRALAFDLGTGKVAEHQLPAHPVKTPPPSVVGPDGLLYFIIATFKSGLGVHAFDPATNELRLRRELGASRPHSHAALAHDGDDRLFVAAYETAHDQTVLFEIDLETDRLINRGPIGDGRPVAVVADATHVQVQLEREGARRNSSYSRLIGSVEVVPTPPAVPDKVNETDHPEPAPLLELDLSAGNAAEHPEGLVTLRWRHPGETDWREIRHGPHLSSQRIQKLLALPDGRVMCIADGMAIVDPVKPRVFVDIPVYVYWKWPSLILGGRLYSTSGEKIRVFNLAAADLFAERPRHLEWVCASAGMERLVDLAPGPEGVLLFTGRQYRTGPVDTVGWLDPESLECRAVREPFQGEEVRQVVAVPDRDLLAVMTRGNPGRVVFLTLPDLKVAGSAVPLKGTADPGRLYPAGPGRLLGVAWLGDPARPVLYGLTADDARVAFLKLLPGTRTRSSPDFHPGPDGKLYGFLGLTLIRIDPRDAHITVLGGAAPADLAFAGGALYRAGERWLTRVTLHEEE